MSLSENDMRQLVTLDIAERLAYQRERTFRAIGGSIVVPASGNIELALNVSNEGDFLSERITGRIIPSDFATYYGITMSIFDNSKVELVENIAAESLLTPGYGMAILAKIDFKHLFERASTIRVKFSNSTAIAQTVHVTFLGERLR